MVFLDEKSLKAKIDEHVKLIKLDAKGINEAPERATAFLVMVALLADEKRACEQDKAKLTTLSSATFSQAIYRSPSKGVTEKKIEAEADEAYAGVRESLEECEAKISWLRTYMEIFNNAHITYRQFAKE